MGTAKLKKAPVFCRKLPGTMLRFYEEKGGGKPWPKAPVFSKQIPEKKGKACIWNNRLSFFSVPKTVWRPLASSPWRAPRSWRTKSRRTWYGGQTRRGWTSTPSALAAAAPGSPPAMARAFWRAPCGAMTCTLWWMWATTAAPTSTLAKRTTCPPTTITRT